MATTLTHAQDLTGTWEGYSTNIAAYTRIVMVREGNRYVGYSYDEGGGGFCKANFIGSFDPDNKMLTGRNASFIDRTPDHVLVQYRLTYEKTEGVHYLRGFITTAGSENNILGFADADRLTLRRVMKRVDTTEFMKDIMGIKNKQPVKPLVKAKKDSIKVSTPLVKKKTEEKSAAEKIKTETVIQQPNIGIPVKTDSRMLMAKQKRFSDTLSKIVSTDRNISISIFDNGQVDGDTITVFYNNQVILANHFVSATPFKLNFTLDKDQSRHEITVIANSLGSIPPNTAVLIIDAGDKKYRLSASSDMNRNALIVIDYKDNF
jgi:hypothetical protein